MIHDETCDMDEDCSCEPAWVAPFFEWARGAGRASHSAAFAAGWEAAQSLHTEASEQ